MKKILIKNATIVNEGKIFSSDLLIMDQKIEKIGTSIEDANAQIIDATGLHLLPGLIDDQVHFREPGLTHKGTIYSEAKAAVAGGITSFMEMPNTVPNALTQELLADKYNIASQRSLANYSFFMGVSNSNYDEVMRTNPQEVCGIKIFMGSSTGNMLVNDENVLEKIFANAPTLIATHCESEPIIQANMAAYVEKYGANGLKSNHHPEIRNEEACYASSSHARDLALKYGTRLHILHISTAEELNLFRNDIPLKDKKITAEVCTHHLWFSADDYDRLGNFIKWNPAVKAARHKDQILQAVIDDRIDVLATDHAPHTLEEKQKPYAEAPSGGPLVQHALLALLEFYHQGKITLQKIVEKTSHNVATLFRINQRGFIREGYFADLVLVDLNQETTVNRSNLLYHCGWSPFEGQKFNAKVVSTFVSGHLVYHNGQFNEQKKGLRMQFNG